MTLKQCISALLPHCVLHFLREQRERHLLAGVRQFHKQQLRQVKAKRPVRVVFLVIHRSVWKVDVIFRDMLRDDAFEPLILVCPYVAHGDDEMHKQMMESESYFTGQGYPVISSYREDSNSWVDLERDLDPDMLFFTNPHNLTRPEYYQEAFFRYLSCYVPYAHQVSRYDDYQAQYNQLFHNAMWRIFAPHRHELDIFRQFATCEGRNVEVTGYPGMEGLIRPCSPKHEMSVWKSAPESCIRIVWAPHHTIDMPELPYSTFLMYAEYMLQLVRKYDGQVQWAFKPHPLLRGKLYQHCDWGPQRTDSFFQFWQSGECSQLEEGEYIDLFRQSDAIVHDSGSFLAEYLYTKKPVMFLLAQNDMTPYFNDFGVKALKNCYLGSCKRDIVEFLEKVLQGSDSMRAIREDFYREELEPFYSEKTPSGAILEILKTDLQVEA